MNLDSKDYKIIEVLNKDSRTPIRDIAKLTNLKSSTVHDRIKKLIENRIIEKFTLKLNNELVNESIIAFVSLSLNETLPKTFFENSRLKEAFEITGEYDLLLKLKFRDLPDFNKYLADLRKNKSIKSFTTSLSTSSIKEVLH